MEAVGRAMIVPEDVCVAGAVVVVANHAILLVSSVPFAYAI